MCLSKNSHVGDNLANATTEQKSEQKQSKLEQYFEENKKFFNNGDSSAKKAFFTLGQYCRQVMDCAEKADPDEKFQKKVNQIMMGSLTYRAFSELTKILDAKALQCNPKLFYSCSGTCKQFMIQSDLPSNKKALPVEDANTSFSLGLYQKF